jgi:hypothetical protein
MIWSAIQSYDLTLTSFATRLSIAEENGCCSRTVILTDRETLVIKYRFAPRGLFCTYFPWLRPLSDTIAC